MATPMQANVGVRDKGSSGSLSYKMPDSLKGGHCTFDILPNGEQEQAVFKLSVDGEVKRIHESAPFPIGSVTVVSKKVKGQEFVVKIKKPRDVKLDQYFT